MRSDEATFLAIVKKYQQPLYGYIRRVVVRHEDSEDILQETFAKVFRKLWQVRSEEALGGWIYRIATNEINRFFKRKRIILVSEELPEAAIATEEVDKRKAAEILIPKAIGKLTQLEREVFCLKYYEDMDYEQISHITGANKNTLMVTWHNAKKKIKEEILK